jgi:hypothetical protein
MSNLQELLDVGKELGYSGKELQDFVKEQQEKQREERQKERQFQLEQEQLRLVEEDKKRAHEVELKRLESERHRNSPTNSTDGGSGDGVAKRTPKLPAFVDGKDDIDSYLQRFERFAKHQRWERTEWATCLSALLTGAALDVYSRLGDEDAQDYDVLKKELLKRYDLTEEGYRNKFRSARPYSEETPSQLLVRLTGYCDKWLELSELPQTCEGVKKLMIREQFMRSCPKELTSHLI